MRIHRRMCGMLTGVVLGLSFAVSAGAEGLQLGIVKTV